MEPASRPLELVATTTERIVGLVEFQGRLILTTEHGIYRYEKGEFKAIKLVKADD